MTAITNISGPGSSGAPDAVATVRDLRRSYGDFTAVDGVSFTIAANKIHGLLGRNGAGKTTIMHMLTGQEFPSSGSVAVFGENPLENERILSRICFIKEGQKYPDQYRVRDVLSTAARFFPEWNRELADDLLRDFDLPPKRFVRKLSRGMLSSVGIIIGLASRAPLTIFDEPYLGLDAVARQLFYDRLLADYAEHPRTIVLSTHLIDEVSDLIEHVLLIDHGRILMDASAESLRDSAVLLSGPRPAVDRLVGDRRVLHREGLANLARVTVEAPEGIDKEDARALGVSVEPISLQQLIVRTTTSERTNPPGGTGDGTMTDSTTREREAAK